jgi:3-isopropylmalate dehydrogenase
MLVRYSLGREDAAAAIENAVAAVLDKGLRTPDIAAPGQPTIGTIEMGKAVLAAL